MPRLTDARRDLRRTQIIEAAVRCFSRRGLDQTSIADITAESGLSAGSIYAHYRNKADLLQAVARAVLDRHAATLSAYAAESPPPNPDELLARLVTTIDPAYARVGVQTWGAATTDPALREIVTGMVARLRDLLLTCVAAWLSRVGNGDPAEAGPIVERLMVAYQAQLLRAALQDAEPSAPDRGKPDPP
ncbi:TetR/AcrR family transcriptional regulator [Pseudosporangium ferrugineum]|uniref:TetR/AcrR family transcriptional regulator n=1 Tax=Pseudosporangium ferrugineum TaxID=439699 RepID=UPI00130493FC|nr:TetR/AcrR family transcriptional regulator [Pseudosporangium ferrugineum]